MTQIRNSKPMIRLYVDQEAYSLVDKVWAALQYNRIEGFGH